MVTQADVVFEEIASETDGLGSLAKENTPEDATRKTPLIKSETATVRWHNIRWNRRRLLVAVDLQSVIRWAG